MNQERQYQEYLNKRQRKMQEKALEHNHDYQPNDNFKNVLNSFPTQSKFPFY